MSKLESPGPVPRRRKISRFLLVLAVLTVLIALFYVEENWRGRRAWDACRRQLEAQGAVLDWAAYIPPPVPGAQNVFNAPAIADWFQKNGPLSIQADSLKRQLQSDMMTGFSYRPQATNDLLVADVTIVPAEAQVDRRQGDALLQMADPNGPNRVSKLLRESVGPVVGNVRGLTFLARPPNQVKPLRLLIATDLPVGVPQLKQFFATNALAPQVTSGAMTSQLRVRASGSNSYKVSLSPQPCAAADYLALNKSAEADLSLIRDALKRPYARMEGDYQNPTNVPIPNFITVRMVVQTLAERAQCHLLLNQPEAALQELTLMHDLRFLLLGKPPAHQLTMVAAMIHVAVCGLYEAVVADGLRLHAWQEPQLVVLQQQLAEIDLFSPFYRSMETERTSSCHLLERTRPSQLAGLFTFGPVPRNFWTKFRIPRYFLLSIIPRGWIYQNMVTVAHRNAAVLEGLDLTNRLASPHKVEQIVSETGMAFTHFSPYTFIASFAVPNLIRAAQTVTRNQALASEALVACALERQRVARHEYPETLAALLPQYLERIPLDPITGQPLKYRRTEDGRFVLYSVGWNETDDGGVPGQKDTEGDWVWPQ